jgi:glycosyltransferase involved in cell wall biosynthesis
MYIVAIVFPAIMLFYILLIYKYYTEWKKYPEYKPFKSAVYPYFSIIIPFRNEQANLPVILNDLTLQEYPVGNFEIIIVDDHSTDQSAGVIKDFCQQNPACKFYQLPEEKTGKKEALLKGIENASHELIVTIDADCRYGRQWLSTLASFYIDNQPIMIIGPVIVDSGNDSFFHYFQQLDMISITGSGAASAMAGKPIYCSGANLCYVKRNVIELDDPLVKSISSGDDTLLLLQLKKRYSSRIKFLKSLPALALTKPEKDIFSFFVQRSRWISKSRHYHDFDILFPALLVLITNIVLITSFFLMVCCKMAWLFLGLFTVKLIFDGMFLKELLKFFKIKFRWLPYFFSELFYPFYLMIILFMNFIIPLKWKGRIVKS